MPLAEFYAQEIPATDYSPLAGIPLRRCILQGLPLQDISFLQDSPVRELSLYGCEAARGFAVVSGLKSLELLILPSGFRHLPEEELTAIGSLRDHPALKNIQSDKSGEEWPIQNAQSKDVFWQDWDREQAFVPALRKSGFEFSVFRLPSRTYRLVICGEALSDLSMLQGAPIGELQATGGQITDISALAGMPLTSLNLKGTAVADLGPLLKCPTLRQIVLPECARDVGSLRALPALTELSYEYKTGGIPTRKASEFWQDFEQRAWQFALRDAGIAIKSMKQLPDGTWEVWLHNSTISDLAVLSGAPISTLSLGLTAVSDLEPLRGMPLKKLLLYHTKVTDLSPLQGMKIESLHLSGTKVNDLSVLRGMPLNSLRLHDCTEAIDLSPLAQTTTLKQITLPPQARNFEFLREFPIIERISYKEDSANLPDKTAAEFWKEYDMAKK